MVYFYSEKNILGKKLSSQHTKRATMTKNISGAKDLCISYCNLFMLFVTIIFAAGGCSRKGGKTVIEGSFPFAMNQKVVCFHMNSSALEPVDSAVADDKGRFRFTFHTDFPEFYSIQFDESKKNIILAVHPGEKITLASSVKEYWRNYTVRGSEDSEKVNELVRNQELYQEDFRMLAKTFYDSLYSPRFASEIKPELDSAYNRLVKEKREFVRDFVRKNCSYLAGLMALYQQVPSAELSRSRPVLHPEEDYMYYHMVDSALNVLYPASTPVRMLRSQMIAYEEQRKAKESNVSRAGKGMFAPEIVMVSLNGDTIQLSSFRGKTVCLIFWASWDQKSRALNKMLRQEYFRMNPKEVQLLQISLDRSKDAWQKAVADDRLSWPQVSDLKFWNSPVVKLYSVETLPMIIVVGKDGRIFERDVPPEKLIAVIAAARNNYETNE